MTDRPLTDLDAAPPFADRHIGPRADDVAAMLEAVGYGSLDDADRRRGARRHPRRRRRSTCRPAATEAAVLARAARARRRATGRVDLDDRAGLLRHASPRR